MRTSSLLPLISPLLLALSACGSGEVIDTLSGTVVDSLGAPAAGVRVQVGERIVSTDAAGHFSLTAVTSPYDVALVTTDNPNPYLFFGLTGAEPTLRVHDQYLSAAGDEHGASIALDLLVAPGSTEHVAFIIDRPDDLSPIRLITDSRTAPGQIPVTVGWAGGDSTTVRVQAFRYQAGTSNAPQHYTGYDAVILSLASGEKTSWKASWKAPPFEDAKVSVSAELPPGYQIVQSDVGVHQDGTLFGQFFAWSKSASTDVSFVVPGLDDLRLDLSVCAVSTDASSCRIAHGLAAGAHGAKLTLDEGPALRSPGAVAETVGVGSEIEWAANGDGACFVMFYPKYPAVGPSYFIASADEAVTLPDLAKLGTKLPSGVDYNFQVFRNGGVATVDDLAAEGPLSAPSGEASTYAYSPLLPVKTR